MRKLPLLFLFVFLVGCEYSVSLTESPDLEIDKAVLGLWERTVDGDRVENVLVLPLDEKEYLVFYSEKHSGLYARAGLVKIGDKTLVQIKWLGTSEGGLPDSDDVYQYATYDVNADSLTVQLMNSGLISTGIKTTEALTKAVQDNLNNPEFVKEAMVFTKVK